MGYLCRRIVFLGASILVILLCHTTGADEGKLGWHGEKMPDGLLKGKTEGEYLWEKDQAVMVYVPAGPFPMGSSEGPADEQPIHQVHLDAYYIDKYETTWKQWKLSKLPYSDRPHARLNQPEPPDWGIVDDQPMINVTWHDARAYTEWAKKRLPTEAEWEKAARGTDSRMYPWGNEPPNFDRAVWQEHPTAAEHTEIATCCAEGASPYGAVNMAGNVYEWCEDTYDPGYYRRSPKRNPVNNAEGKFRVLRGGAFVLPEDVLRSAYRYRLLAVDRAAYIGFRTVLSGEAHED